MFNLIFKVYKLYNDIKIKYINRSKNQLEIEKTPHKWVLNFLYNNPFGNTLILPIAKQKIVSDWYGERMDSSSSKKRIEPFVKEFNIDMSEAEKKINEFESFNDFFFRKLKFGARKIENGLVSPCDAKILAFKNISEVNSFYVKGDKFTLNEFLQDDDLAKKHRNSSLVILRLAPNDYHRYHFPYDGFVSGSKKIEGVYYSVSPICVNQNFAKVFSENKKEICRLETDKGEIVIVPVGATLVGSINTTYTPNSLIKKGDEMGYFAYGGSTVVMLFNSHSFELDSDLIQNTKNKLETFVKMGEKIGQ